ncbi:phosphoglycerate dehydrogenase [Pseudonocardia sp. RS010]|uniref:phosphoglycerate dehydrogenase n=1 Tax=Pseudonocardia sp. RS010 TaxID=3385979 RepID=UPI00399FAD15
MTDGPSCTLHEGGCELVDGPYGKTAHPEINDVGMRDAEVVDLLQGVDAAIVGAPHVTREVLAQLPQLKMIARRGAGYDTIDIAAATEAGVLVTITPGTNELSVAEQAIALMFAVAKSVVWYHGELQQGAWRRRLGIELDGKTLGLVGVGRIGSRVALKAKALGMSVVAYDVAPNVEWAAANGVELLGLEDVLRRADVISLHTPLLPSTRGMIGAAEIELMKPTAILVNTARGPVIDQPALVKALEDRRIFGAGLDTFDPEPIEEGSPLLTMDNVVLTPHVGGATREAPARGSQLAAEFVVMASRRERPPAAAVINPEVFEVSPYWTGTHPS